MLLIDYSVVKICVGKFPSTKHDKPVQINTLDEIHQEVF